MELLLRTLSPVAVNDYAFVRTGSFFDIRDNSPEFRFGRINMPEEHDHDEREFILRSKLGNWLFWQNPHEYSLIPKDVQIRVPLLALLEPSTKQFSASFTEFDLYELVGYGSSAEQVSESLFVAVKPRTTFVFYANVFSPDICAKISKIAHIQLNQLKNLAVLLGFEHNDRLISSVNFLLENTPEAQDGCLVHWTFSQLQDLVSVHIDINPVMIFVRKLTGDLGYELMPLNWAIVERA